jgi:recombination associated protein RdgC
MQFKNLVVYRLQSGLNLAANEIEEKLAERTLMPCGAFDMASRGWVFPADSDRYMHSVEGHHLIALGVDQKILPAGVIRQVCAERAKTLSAEQGYPVGRRQMRELKMRVTEELRGRAMTRNRVTHAWINPTAGLLVVNASGDARAEELVTMLRETIGSLQVTRLESERSPSVVMTAWLLAGDAPLTFTIDDEAELQAADKSRPTVRYMRHALDGKGIRAHIEGGMYATRLGLTWKDRVSFVLNEKLQLRRLQFLELADSKPAAEEANAAEEFDAQFLLMAGELTAVLADLERVIGGDEQGSALA